ncbi:MAG TPA: RNA-binding cell elongation regulator Jag/EloR [bacterium]|nr:RNA-binding cell elongation regulator Jag/EloR [bacterium]
MRNYSNQQGIGRSSGGNRGGGYKGGQGGHGGNRHRDSQDRGNYRGGNSRHESGEHRHSEPRRNDRPGYGRSDRSHSGGNYDRGNRSHGGGRPERHERHERTERPEGAPRGNSWVEVSGRSVEEALEEASRRFNVSQADLKTEVKEEGSRGFLGLGSKPAVVRISLKPQAVPAFAEGVLSRLLRGMGLPDKVRMRKDEDGNTVLNIEGPSSGTLIGRHGHTLESLQYLVSKTTQRITGDEKSIVVVDVENYLERQKDKLRELAQNLAQKAKETGVEVPMRPMSSKDRRIVHLTLKDHEHVTTESRGEGLRRKVVIVPKVKAEPKPEGVPSTETSKASVDLDETQPVVPNQPVAAVAQIEEPAHTDDQPQPGNMVPKEPDLDDDIGNRV